MRTLIESAAGCMGSASSRRRFFEGLGTTGFEVDEVSRMYGGP